MTDDEYVWDIALSTRLDPSFEEVAEGTREAVILNILTALDHADVDTVPLRDVAHIIMNLWLYMDEKVLAERKEAAR